jgi:hypothetical protein
MSELPSPEDDSFVTTAIRGLRIPAHNPDFWDHLAWRLDDAADEMVAEGLLEAVMPRVRTRAAARAPLPVDIEGPDDAWPEPEPDLAPAPPPPPAPEPEVDLFGPIAEPDGAPVTEAFVFPSQGEAHAARTAPLRAGRPRVLVDAPSSAPLAAHRAEPVVQHDPAVLPQAVRSRTNAALVALAVLAAVVAVVAGLTLVRQRSDNAAPASSVVDESGSEQPVLSTSSQP